jgi:TonB family protein
MQLPDLESLWLGVANHLWQCALVLVPLFGLARLFRRASARAQNLLWCVSAAKLLLPLAILGRGAAALIDAAWPERGDAIVLGLQGSPLVTWLSPTEVWVVSDATSAGVDPFLLLTLLWLAGGVALVSYWSRHRRIDRDASSSCGLAPELRRRLRTGSAGSVIPLDRVTVTDGGSVPALVGLWRPRIEIPRALVEHLAADELRAILLHETAHLRRRDTVRSAGLRVLLLAFYYFPPLWIVLRRIRRTAELACDEWVVEQGVPRELYIRALSRTVQIGVGTSPAIAAGGDGSFSFLRRRFERIRDARRYHTMPRHRIALVAAVALVTIASFYPFAPSWTVMAGDSPVALELTRLAEGDLPVTLNFKERDCREIIEALSTTLPFEVRYEGELGPSTRIVSITMEDVTAADVLERIAELTGVSYRVPDPRTLVVIAPQLAGVDGVTHPRIIPGSRVSPVFPEEARKEGIGGKVFLQAVLDEFGIVRRVDVLRGVPDHVEFEEAAVAAVRQWRYEPATKDDVPVPIVFTVIVDFTLDDDEKTEKLETL